MKKITILFLLIAYSNFAQLKPINIVDLNFKVGAISEHEMMYGFAEGDKITINFSEEKSKKLKSFEIIEYPSTNKFSDFNVVEILNKEITIQKTGIYIFRFENTSLGGRICKFSIDRIPASEDKISFNTTVKSRTVSDTTFTSRFETYVKSESYKVKEIAKNQHYFINSGSNALFKDGKSRVTLPIALPNNTVKWYYTVSSFRDNNLIESTMSQINLVSDLTKLIDKSGGVSFAIDLLTQPPGANFCDVYLINNENYSLFLNKSEYRHFTVGTRENIVSANVEIPFTSNEVLYLGIKNPDGMHGINVIVSAAAIVLEKELATREIITPNISYSTEYYLD